MTEHNDLNLHSENGSFRVMTAYVTARKVFLSLVLFEGTPFDIQISQTEEEARQAHTLFTDGAKIMNGLLGNLNAGSVDRSMLN